jgi:hypothetical protein
MFLSSWFMVKETPFFTIEVSQEILKWLRVSYQEVNSSSSISSKIGSTSKCCLHRCLIGEGNYSKLKEGWIPWPSWNLVVTDL